MQVILKFRSLPAEISLLQVLVVISQKYARVRVFKFMLQATCMTLNNRKEKKADK